MSDFVFLTTGTLVERRVVSPDEPRSVYVPVECEHPPFGSPLVDIVAWFGRVLESVPAEYRASVKMDYDGDDLTIFYYRMETPAEVAERRNRDRAAADEEEERERSLLASLRAKYG